MNLENRAKLFLQKAEIYLFNSLGNDYLWRDFYTNTHKESVDWATGFVGDFLINSSVQSAKLQRIADALAMRQRIDGGWSYNEITFSSDADTTSSVAPFLSYFGLRYDEQLKLARTYLLNHQRPSGGFATFNEDEVRQYSRLTSLESVAGWCSETPDITARVINALKKLSGTNQHVFAAKNYLAGEQRRDGGWNCYWWNCDVYSTAFCSMLLPSYFAEKGRAWLAENITNLPFYDALSLFVLSDRCGFEKEKNELVYNLFSAQQIDGSCISPPTLQFPHPSNITPWAWKGDQFWRIDCADQNHLFTTVTAYAAIKKLTEK